MVCHVAGGGRYVGQGARALDVGAHGQQHALDIEVVDDGDGAAGARQISALGAIMRKTHCFLLGLVGNRNALYAHGKAGGVHHDEHVFEAAVLLADQVAHSAGSGAVCNAARRAVAKLQHSRRAGLDAELVA